MFAELLSLSIQPTCCFPFTVNQCQGDDCSSLTSVSSSAQPSMESCYAIHLKSVPTPLPPSHTSQDFRVPPANYLSIESCFTTHCVICAYAPPPQKSSSFRISESIARVYPSRPSLSF